MNETRGRNVQPVASLPGYLGDLRAISTAGGGSALTSTYSQVRIPEGVSFLFLTPRNYTGAVVVQVGLGPYLSVFKTVDDAVTFTDYSVEAQDGDAATDVTLSSLGTAAQGDYLYVGAPRPFRGIKVDVDAANANASVLSGKYFNGDSWADASITDGTASGGATFAIDGDITWTVHSGWKKTKINGREMYWMRFQASAALDSTTTQNSFLPMCESTSYFELQAGQTLEIAIDRGPNGYSTVEAKTDAGTANLIINVASGGREL